MKVLVVGGGAREHSICHAISTSELVSEIYCAPGNAGTDKIATPVPVKSNNITEIIEDLLEFSKDNEIDFVIVGPEAYLVAGIVDVFEENGIKIFGPSKEASILEGSKVFMKELCFKYNIPTASYNTFTNEEEAIKYVHHNRFPMVIKEDGLAAGKGVTIINTGSEAEWVFTNVFKIHKLHEINSNKIIIEEFLEGEELSFFVLADGDKVLPLASAQDYKRAYDGDEGRNTGGMGACSPAPMMTKELENQIMSTIIIPTISAMKEEGREYRGILYAGIMLTDQGPKLLEYNIRFGDPECQVLMARLDVDLLDLLVGCVEQTLTGKIIEGGEGAGHRVLRRRLQKREINWSDDVALTVVMANNGYPGAHETGSIIRGLNQVEKRSGISVFHGGTLTEDGNTVAVGGRVLSIVATASTVEKAKKKAYDAIDKINWPEGWYRKDIGWRSLNR